VSPSAHRTEPDALSFLWAWRGYFVVGACAGALVGALAAYAFGGKYLARAYVQMPGMSFSDYRKYSTGMNDRERVLKYFSEHAPAGTTLDALVRPALESAEGLSDLARPFFALTRGDVKDLAEQFKDASTFVGFEVGVRGADAEEASLATRLLVDYVRNGLLAARIDEWLAVRRLGTTTDLARQLAAEKKLIADLAVSTEKLKSMREIVRRYPVAARSDGRQVVSVQDGGARYLPPEAQLVGVESQIVEMTEQFGKLRNDIRKNELLIAYYARAAQAVAGSADGRKKLQALAAALDAVDRARTGDRAGSDEGVVVARSEIAVLDAQFPTEITFMSAGGVSVNRLPRRLVELVATGGAAGALLLAVVALLVFWRRESAADESS